MLPRIKKMEFISGLFGGGAAQNVKQSYEPYNPNRFSNAKLQAALAQNQQQNVNAAQTVQAPVSQPAPVVAANDRKTATAYVDLVNSGAERGGTVSGPMPATMTTNRNDVGPGGAAPFVSRKETNSMHQCPQDAPDENRMDGWMLQNGQSMWNRSRLNQERVEGTAYGQIYMMPGGVVDGQYGPGMTPNFSQYDTNNYRKEVLDSDRRISTGVLVNAYTGKMSETFEDDLPPPNTDASIQRQQFEQTNPRLIQMNGGIDPNKKLPSKKEICLNLPRADDGPNVWGDQLFADRRRQELMQRVQRDTWMNRNGDHSIEKVDDRKPVGYVGYVNTVRPLPYLPPTQRTTSSNMGMDKGPAFYDNAPAGAAHNVIMPRISIRKPDLTQCPRSSYAQGYDGQFAGAVVAKPSVCMTEREATAERSWNGHAASAGDGAYVVQDTNVKDTLKSLMQQEFPVSNGANAGQGAYVVQDTTLKPTLKGLMQSEFPVSNSANPHQGGYVVQDTTVRDTLKSLMQDAFPVTNSAGVVSAYVVQDTDVRDTQKTLMQQEFGAHGAGRGDQQPTATGVIVGGKQEYPKASVDVIESTNDPSNAGRGGDGGHIPFQGDINPTRRQYYEDKTHTGVASGQDWGMNAPQLQANCDKPGNWRGENDVNWFPVSRVPEDAGGTNSRWIGYHDTQTRREMSTRFQLPQRRELNEPRPNLLSATQQVACGDSGSNAYLTSNNKNARENIWPAQPNYLVRVGDAGGGGW